MPAKKQQQAGKKAAVVSKSQKKTNAKPSRGTLPGDEAPMIIKGSAQGPAIVEPFTIKFDYPLDFTYEPGSSDIKPYVYTLPGNMTVSKVVINSPNCKQCSTEFGEFEIKIYLKKS